MKKIQIYLVLILIGVLLSLNSCDDTSTREFKDFNEVKEVLTELQTKGVESKDNIEKLSDFHSLNDEFESLKEKEGDELKEAVEKSKEFLVAEPNGDGSETLRLKIDKSLASIADKEGNVQVGDEVHNLLKEDELKLFKDDIVDTVLQANDIANGIAADAALGVIMPDLSGALAIKRLGGMLCYSTSLYRKEGKCVSVNNKQWELLGWSSAIQHVELFPFNSYKTKYFDIKINGKDTRIQMWKGHMAAVALVGSEISVWKTIPMPTIQRRVLFYTKVYKIVGWKKKTIKILWKKIRIKVAKWKWVKTPVYGLVIAMGKGPIWKPYYNNQLKINWYLINKRKHKAIITFGKWTPINATSYSWENKKKWWAGKWINNSFGTNSRWARDYTLVYEIIDKSGKVIKKGSW